MANPQTVFEKAKMRYSEETWEEKIDAITIYTFANTRGLGLKPDGVWLALPRSTKPSPLSSRHTFANTRGMGMQPDGRPLHPSPYLQTLDPP